MKTAIVYYTKTGHTLEAAEAVAEGVREAGGSADIIHCQRVPAGALADYDVLLFGSPCWMGRESRTGICGPIKSFLRDLDPAVVKGKTCGGFAVQGGLGADRTVKAIGEILAAKGCARYAAGPYASAGVFLSLWKGPSVKPRDLERFREYGRKIHGLSSNPM